MSLLMQQMQAGIKHHLETTVQSERYQRVEAPHAASPSASSSAATPTASSAGAAAGLADEDFLEVREARFPLSQGGEAAEEPGRFGFSMAAYAPHAFAHFWAQFGVRPEAMLASLCEEPLEELVNPGKSGSLLWFSGDGAFVLKSLDANEQKGLLRFLRGYQVTLFQRLISNKRLLLPKFFGMYEIASGDTVVRFTIFNNLLPKGYDLFEVFDLKGSTVGRSASPEELRKARPVLKDLDYNRLHAAGLYVEEARLERLADQLTNECSYLEGFAIMDYSMLVGLHAIAPDDDRLAGLTDEQVGEATGGIVAYNPLGQRLLVFLGIIDVLQKYRTAKKVERMVKSVIYDSDLVSVTDPVSYSTRFQGYIVGKVFTPISPDELRGYEGPAESAVTEWDEEVEAVRARLAARGITILHCGYLHKFQRSLPSLKGRPAPKGTQARAPRRKQAGAGGGGGGGGGGGTGRSNTSSASSASSAPHRKSSKRRSPWTKWWFLLTPSVLSYARNQEVTPTGAIRLVKVRSARFATAAETKRENVILVETALRTHKVAAPDHHAAKAWLAAIAEAVAAVAS